MAKNDWFMKDSKSTAKGLLITRIGVGIIAVIFLIYGLFVKSTDPTFLYAALHPASALNIIGFILFLLFLSYIAGYFAKIIDAIGVPVGSSWNNWVAFACGVLGVVFMYA